MTVQNHYSGANLIPKREKKDFKQLIFKHQNVIKRVANAIIINTTDRMKYFTHGNSLLITEYFETFFIDMCNHILDQENREQKLKTLYDLEKRKKISLTPSILEKLPNVKNNTRVEKTISKYFTIITSKYDKL